MNDILQKRIEEAAIKEREQCREDNNEIWRGNPTYNDVEASFIKGATFALQNQWISVEEALPPMTQESGQVYLTVDKLGYTDVKARNLDGWSSPRCWCSNEQITHWMPIPEMPKGGEE